VFAIVSVGKFICEPEAAATRNRRKIQVEKKRKAYFNWIRKTDYLLFTVATVFLVVFPVIFLSEKPVEAASSSGVQKETALVDWGQNYIEATGMAVAPDGSKGAQGKALARRGAIVDLQRNLLESVGGVQIDSRTTMNDFMAEDRVRSEVHGLIRNVELLDGKWDGESYTVTGRIRTAGLRVIVEYCQGLHLR
jgi:hypothetical protein